MSAFVSTTSPRKPHRAGWGAALRASGRTPEGLQTHPARHHPLGASGTPSRGNPRTPPHQSLASTPRGVHGGSAPPPPQGCRQGVCTQQALSGALQTRPQSRSWRAQLCSVSDPLPACLTAQISRYEWNVTSPRVSAPHPHPGLASKSPGRKRARCLPDRTEQSRAGYRRRLQPAQGPGAPQTPASPPAPRPPLQPHGPLAPVQPRDRDGDRGFRAAPTAA